MSETDGELPIAQYSEMQAYAVIIRGAHDAVGELALRSVVGLADPIPGSEGLGGSRLCNRKEKDDGVDGAHNRLQIRNSLLHNPTTDQTGLSAREAYSFAVRLKMEVVESFPI
jgi:hypothetical protein